MSQHQENRQFYFLAQRVSGEFGSGVGDEMVGRAAPEAGTYQAVWLSTQELLEQPVYPRELCELIANAVGSSVFKPQYVGDRHNAIGVWWKNTFD